MRACAWEGPQLCRRTWVSKLTPDSLSRLAGTPRKYPVGTATASVYMMPSITQFEL